MMPAQADITGLLLAGGEGRRMGGGDKGLQPFADRTLAAHVMDRLRPQVGSLIVSANRNLARYAALGAPVVVDTLREADGGHAGPLAGLLAGLRACQTPWLLCVPCDTPFVPLDLGARLAAAIDDQAGTPPVVAWACTAATANRPARSHPTCCLLRTDLADSLQHDLDAGERRVERWLRRQPHVEVCFDNAAAFDNLNTLDALRQAADGTPAS